MSKSTAEQMAIMVDAVQPHCDEKIKAAITCGAAGSIQSLLISKLLGQDGGVVSSSLPTPLFLAVGENTIYAFKYVPRGFKFKIKKEVARWPKADVNVKYEFSKTLATFVLSTKTGENYALEFAVIMGGRPLGEMFFAAFQT